jgi:hypothetical protein
MLITLGLCAAVHQNDDIILVSMYSCLRRVVGTRRWCSCADISARGVSVHLSFGEQLMLLRSTVGQCGMGCTCVSYLG